MIHAHHRWPIEPQSDLINFAITLQHCPPSIPRFSALTSFYYTCQSCHVDLSVPPVSRARDMSTSTYSSPLIPRYPKVTCTHARRETKGDDRRIFTGSPFHAHTSQQGSLPTSVDCSVGMFRTRFARPPATCRGSRVMRSATWHALVPVTGSLALRAVKLRHQHSSPERAGVA